ncbi:MAG TPA: penicillin acylase family protein [Mycobacteriales bacterium]|nr:penicillin acylase family protein [Mycobacteriales bacterium]
MRRPAALLVLLLLPALALPAVAQDAPPPDAGGAVLNILPPGSRGNVTVPQALQVGPSRTADGEAPPNFADQLEQYDAINTVDPASLTEADLPDFFKDAGIDLPADQAVSTLQPRPGVTIRRDAAGVPFVTGQTAEDVAYGAGYAGTQDRMFLTDLLRHVGAARTAEFLGGSAGNIAMDRDQLRSAAYTREEAEAQLESVLARYPDEGADLLRRLDAFVAGINDAQRALCPAAGGVPLGEVFGGELVLGAGFGPDCPVEYAVLQTPPTDFDRADVVYIASLVGGIFGKGGGSEAANARWFQQLSRQYGDAGARAVFEDLRLRNDPEAPTTASRPFPYEGQPIDPAAPGAALPDLDGPTAPSTGSDAGGSTLPIPLPGPLAGSPVRAGVVDGPLGPIDLGLGAGGSMSNALLVGADRTATGSPLVVFGPQTGYFTPQLLTEISLRGPGIAARGVSFAGTQLIVELGHGVDYAWSATSASSDNVDTVVERLCSLDGGEVTLESDGYLVDTTCTPFDSYVHTQTVVPTAAGQGPPARLRMRVERTRHGIVQERATVGGTPVAVVLQRSTYGRELDSAVGFARINDPEFTRDAASFAAAFAAVDYTFNWFYADDRDIAYFGSGLLPLRAPGHNPDLPRWGDTRFDWQGTLPDDEHAQDLNPAQGFLSSWNNKQAPAFSAADGTWGYGPVYRSLLLDARLRDLMAAGPVERAALVGAVQDAAVADLRAEVLLPLLLEVVGDDASLAPALEVLRAWAADPRREDRDRDGAYTHAAAIAVFDQWWEPDDPALSVARTVLREELGDLVDELPKKLDDHPRLGLGSAWNNVAWYGYLSKELRTVLGRPVTGPFSRSYCGDLATCREALRASLTGALERELAEQGVSEVSALTYDKGEDAIRPVTAGLVGTRTIDWQNRPTFQQVVSFTTSRRGAVAAPAAPLRPAAARLPATGGVPTGALAGVVLLAVALGLARRPRA